MRKEPKRSAGQQAASGGAKILAFRRPTHAFPQKRTLPPINDPLRRLEEEEDRRRTRENLGAAVLVLLLVACGFWLIDHLRTNAHIATCLEAGHHDCLRDRP
jgi:hypothetical protein